MQGYRISTELHELQLDVIHGFISQSYWASGIPAGTLEKAIQNSLCFGVYLDTAEPTGRGGEQIGFARLITDKATFAYLADVFILDAHRGKGVSKWLMEHIVRHPDLQGLRRMMLATRDAHGLYAQYGFEPISNPEVLMQVWRPDIYQSRQS